MARLRRVSPDQPGYRRRRRGKGFSYTDLQGQAVTGDELARIKSLAIPPAWREVWICPHEWGHLQATGVDDAGRTQYLYHPEWRRRRDRTKFDRVVSAAERLPSARRRVSTDLDRTGMPRERAAATAVRLLDVGYFRIGNDAYTDAHGSFGLTTLERHHVRRRGGQLVFSFTGKSGISHSITVDDSQAVAAIETMRRRRDESRRLLVYRQGGSWHSLSGQEVNDYLAELFEGAFTAKDFRTWHATVIAAEVLALSEEPGVTRASRTRAIAQATREVAAYLGNTPTIARNSYIDPRVIDAYERGRTICEVARKRHRNPQRRQEDLERAVLDLLG